MTLLARSVIKSGYRHQCNLAFEIHFLLKAVVYWLFLFSLIIHCGICQVLSFGYPKNESIAKKHSYFRYQSAIKGHQIK